MHASITHSFLTDFVSFRLHQAELGLLYLSPAPNYPISIQINTQLEEKQCASYANLASTLIPYSLL